MVQVLRVCRLPKCLVLVLQLSLEGEGEIQGRQPFLFLLLIIIKLLSILVLFLCLHRLGAVDKHEEVSRLPLSEQFLESHAQLDISLERGCL